MADTENGFSGGRRPLSREQIARRTVSREEVALWTAQSHREEVKFLHYWESKEVIEVSDKGDEYIVFVGRSDVMTAKIWTFLDHTVPHQAYILRPDPEVRYELSDKEGILLRFKFTGEIRIFTKNGLKAIVDELEVHVYQRSDDIILRIVKEKTI